MLYLIRELQSQLAVSQLSLLHNGGTVIPHHLPSSYKYVNTVLNIHTLFVVTNKCLS